MTKMIQFLQSVPIFSQLLENEIERIVPMLQSQTVNNGEIIFNEGDLGKELYIVESGVFVSSVRTANGETVLVAEFTAGNFFGEMSHFENASRSATCYARIKGTLYYLNEEDFRNLRNTAPNILTKILYQILNIISQRMNATGEFLSDMVQWGEGARKRAITDEFTDLFNRRFLDESLSNLFFQAASIGHPLTIIIGDLDHFGEINRLYGHSVGDEVILAVVRVFRKHFRQSDILARYGGDEFIFILPNTKPKEAYKISSNIIADIADLSLLQKKGGSIKNIHTSQGIAGFPEHATDLHVLLKMADKALYAAKEQGRNRAVVAKKNMINVDLQQKHLTFPSERMFTPKVDIPTLNMRNRIINNIIDALLQREKFLVVGHVNPDEDCLGAMTAMALIIRKLGKEVAVCLSVELHTDLSFIHDIWKFNDIQVIDPQMPAKAFLDWDTVIICDTPKPSMLDICTPIRTLMSRRDVLKIEIDHHISADSAYSGNDNHCLVTSTTSTCILIAQLMYKLSQHTTLLRQYHIATIYSRSTVLMVLIGMIGDTGKGHFIQSSKNSRMYNLLIRRMNRMLTAGTHDNAEYITNIEDIYHKFATILPSNRQIQRYIYARAVIRSRIGCLFLDNVESEYLSANYRTQEIVNSLRATADQLAEESGCISLICYQDIRNNLLQCRSRRNQTYNKLDLRQFLERFKVENGGGHAGAIAFRFPLDTIEDIPKFCNSMFDVMQTMLDEFTQ